MIQCGERSQIEMGSKYLYREYDHVNVHNNAYFTMKNFQMHSNIYGIVVLSILYNK